MSLEPLNWDVVVAGYWNPAILTPSGIARRLFGLPEKTPVVVEVPMDGLAPYRVRHGDLSVTAEMGRLVVAADSPRYELLDQARALGAKAVKGLPETPFTAAGYNVRMKISDPPDELLQGLACGVDNLLSDVALTIDLRHVRRSVKMGDGIVNLDIQQEGDVTVGFNFHRQSSKEEELVAWLKSPIDNAKNIVSLVMEKVIRVPMGDIGK